MCNGSDGMLHMNLLCPIYNISAAPGGSLPDIQSAEYTIDLLRQIRKNSAAGNSASDSTDPTPREPFFVGLGFHKPHIPFKVRPVWPFFYQHTKSKRVVLADGYLAMLFQLAFCGFLPGGGDLVAVSMNSF